MISAGFGGPQTIGGPILSVDTQDLIVDPSAKNTSEVWRAGAPLHLLADKLQIESNVAVEVRSKGIYSIPVYVSGFVVTGEFTPDSMARVLASTVDMRVLPLHVTNQEIAGFAALSAPIDLESLDRGTPLKFRLEFELAGSDSLRFLPLASDTTVSGRIAWPHPDFDGALPSPTPHCWRLHSVFACFFACEHVVRGLRLHPMQYLLVGLALATFYLLLLAHSEHVGFAIAYAIAAAALVALITTYIAGATSNRCAAGWIVAALAASHAVLFVILLSEDYALLFGSLLLFAVLSALMLATRGRDWAAVGRRDSLSD